MRDNAAVKVTTHLPVYVSYTHAYVETAASHSISCSHWFGSLRRAGVTTVNGKMDTNHKRPNAESTVKCTQNPTAS